MNTTRNSPIASPAEEQFPRAGGYRHRVLVVDDEVVIADTLSKILSLRGYSATAAYDGDSALESALLEPPDLLLSDVILPGMNGIELAYTIKRVYPDCKILLFSGQAPTVDLMASSYRAGHRFTLLSKPMAPDALLAMIAKQFDPVPERAVSYAQSLRDAICGE
jgi:CheY-like chemotaxis protein